MSDTKVFEPVDALGRPVERAMGLPLLQDQIVLVDATNFVDIYDLSLAKYKTRVFTSLAIRNLSGASTVELAFGGPGASTRTMVCGTQEYFVLDQMAFGPSINDDTTGNHTTKIRARLGTAQGSPATGTIDYHLISNPTAGMNVIVNGTRYTFSPASDTFVGTGIGVSIGGTLDISFQNLAAAITANDQAVVTSVNTGTHILTITSVAGGAAANAIALADGPSPTGAIFSGATLSGAAGGVTPVFHIW